jgi:large subunit ribosomal protein L4
MKLDVYSSTGAKKAAMDLPADLFEAPVNWGLMHQAVIMQQSNRRNPIAHVKTRGEIVGSTKKVYAQKHTGNARRGPIRSPIMRGGGKTFGPRNDANFWKNMPKKMRHAALRSCLSLQAQKDGIILLEDYPTDIKTKTFAALLKKLPIEQGRRTLVVMAGKHEGIQMSSRNVTGVKAIQAAYLNPEDILNSRRVIFLVDAIKVAQDVFGKKEADTKVKAKEEKVAKVAKTAKVAKKPAAKKKDSSSQSS